MSRAIPATEIVVLDMPCGVVVAPAGGAVLSVAAMVGCLAQL